MKTIDEDIKNNTFQTCYLLFGEEAYLKRLYRNKLLSALGVEGDTMNYSAYEGKDISCGALVDLAETLPFFAERRVILVENSGFFKHSCEAMADYLPQMNPTACFIFVESEVDKRSKAYKAAKKVGAAVEFASQKEPVITKWILSRLKKENKKITKATLELFLGRTGLDMGTIDRELEKLLCYTLKKEVIEADDVLAVVTEQPENKIFEMIDAVSGHNRKRALELYYALLELREAPMRILFLIVRQFRILSEVKELTAKGNSSFEIAKLVGAPEFAIRKYQTQAKRFTAKQLTSALFEAAKTEEAVKTGWLNEKTAEEILIIQYSRETKKEWI